MRLKRKTRGASGDLLSQKLRTILKQVLMEVCPSQLEIFNNRLLLTKIHRGTWLQFRVVSLLIIYLLDHKVSNLTATAP